MRTNLGYFAAVVLFCGLAASSGSAADTSSSVAPKAKTTSTKERLLDEFDLNHDGKLDAAERQAARTMLAKRRRQARSAGDAAIASAAGSAAPGAANGYGSSPYNYQTAPYAVSGYFYSVGAGGALSLQTATATGQGAGMGGQCTQMGMPGGSMGGRR